MRDLLEAAIQIVDQKRITSIDVVLKDEDEKLKINFIELQVKLLQSGFIVEDRPRFQRGGRSVENQMIIHKIYPYNRISLITIKDVMDRN